MNGFEKRTEEKKKRALEAAFEMMKRDEQGNITMEDIARNSNVAKATLFKYFGSKDNLIREVFKDFLEKMIDSARKIMEENKSFEEKLIAMSQSKISFLEKINQSFYLKMMEYLTEESDDGLSVMMTEYNQVNNSMMLDLFHKGRKEGKVDLKYSDEFLILYLQTILEGISSPHIYEKIAPYTEEWTEMLIKGLAPGKD